MQDHSRGKSMVIGNYTHAMKDTFFDKLEDEYDLKIIREYEAEKEKGNIKYYSLEEVKRELGLPE